MIIWDFFNMITLMVASMALYFNIVKIIRKIHKGEETFKDTIIGSILLACIILQFYLRIQTILQRF
jgi:hypothetical protein